MADVATLAIQIDSRQAQTARTNLQGLQQTAGRTEQSATKLTAANKNLSESFRNAAGSVAVMHGPLGGVASRLSATGMLVGRMGLAMGGLAIGIGGATFAAQKGVRAFAEYERQLLTTEQVIRATGGAAGRTVEDITSLSREIGVATLASGQQVREAGNMLLTFRSIAGDTFDRTLVAAQDLAAVGFGSVTSATQQLARALEDPEQGLTRLRRVGISFSAAQVDLIKNLNETGRTAQAQNEILKQVEQQVGGAGAAAGGGLAGAFDNLTEATTDWFTLVGENISDLTKLPDIFNAIGNGIRTSTGDMDLSSMGRFLADARAQIEENLAIIERLEQRGQQDSATVGSIRYYEMQNEAIQANVDEVQRFTRAERQLAEVQSQRAQEQMRTDRFEAEMIRQERDAAEARLSELDQMIAKAQERAGILGARSSVDKARAESIEREVTANFRLAEAIDAAKEAEEDRTAAREAVGDTLDSLRDELAVMRELDPAKSRLIELSREMSVATAAEAREARRLAEAIEGARVDDVIRSLEHEIDIMLEADPVMRRMLQMRGDLAGATDAQRAEVEGLVRAQDRLNSGGSIMQTISHSLSDGAGGTLDVNIIRPVVL